MSDQVVAKTGRRGMWPAIAGVVFCDFIGLLLFSLGDFGWILGLGTMLLGAPYSAWISLEAHPRRRALTWRIGIGNALFLLVAAAALFAFALYMLSTVQWG